MSNVKEGNSKESKVSPPRRESQNDIAGNMSNDEQVRIRPAPVAATPPNIRLPCCPMRTYIHTIPYRTIPYPIPHTTYHTIPYQNQKNLPYHTKTEKHIITYHAMPCHVMSCQAPKTTYHTIHIPITIPIPYHTCTIPMPYHTVQYHTNKVSVKKTYH